VDPYPHLPFYPDADTDPDLASHPDKNADPEPGSQNVAIYANPDPDMDPDT